MVWINLYADGPTISSSDKAIFFMISLCLLPFGTDAQLLCALAISFLNNSVENVNFKFSFGKSLSPTGISLCTSDL